MIIAAGKYFSEAASPPTAPAREGRFPSSHIDAAAPSSKMPPR
jgi:hypothetical protein